MGNPTSNAVHANLFAIIELMERAIPILPTADLIAAKAFYVDGLGFQVTFEASNDGRSGLLGLERGTIQLTLDSPMDGHGRNACVSLQVNDADAYYREWSARVAVLREPKNEDWGARTFDLLDPSGNTIFVMGSILTRETH
jgi:catechol 2,3-dioxygenase-like lactoylglutathione lyase family enzyme